MIVRQEDVIRQLVVQQKDHEAQTEALHGSMRDVTAKMEDATAEICLQSSTTCRTQLAVLIMTQTIPRRATHRHETSNTQGRTHKREWDGNKVVSATSWRYAIAPCVSGA